MSIDRVAGPPPNQFGEISIPFPKEFSLDNGVKGWEINSGEEEVLRLEILFNAGSSEQPAPLIATATAGMIMAGTTTKSAHEVAELIDYYGAFVTAEGGKDFASIVLVCLKEHWQPMLELLVEIITEPTFAESEFNNWIDRSRQTFLIEQQKVSTLASRRFRNLLFTEGHPYHSLLDIGSFDQLKLDHLRSFFKENWLNNIHGVIIAGSTDENILGSLNSHIGSLQNSGRTQQIVNHSIAPRKSVELLDKEGVFQSAIRVGKPMFNRTHEDYPFTSILATVLGGYFGSRLMKNIREEKGYTYGIGAGIVSSLKGSYFSISAETGANVTSKALDEIYKEIKLLSAEPVGNEELGVVKNYLLGSLVRSMDGLFALSDLAHALQGFDLDFNYFKSFEKAIHEVTPDQLLQMAQKHLQADEMIEVVAGVKN